MIGNQTKGKSFRGLLNYLENKESSSLIGGNMFGRNARELAREFRLSRQLNPDALKVVHHVSLSLAPDEQLDNDTWCEIADKYMSAMGYTSNQYAIYRHSDRHHDHIHICASRISLDDGKITSDSWEYVRSEKIIRQLEMEYGLQQTSSSKEKLHRAPSVGQQQRIEREQREYEQGLRDTAPQQPIKTQLIELIDRATIDKPTMPQLIERLQLLGVEVRHGVTRNGKSKGISYSWNDQKFSGTSLGPAYTFPGLQKHKGIDYQPERDDQRINVILLIPSVPLPIEQAEKFLQEIELKQTKAGGAGGEVQHLEQELTLNYSVSSPAAPAAPASPAPTFTPPPEDESLRPVLQNFLTQKRGISNFFVGALQRQGLGYIDQQRNVVFIKRDLNGEKSGALVWDTHREDNRCMEYPENSVSFSGWFHLKLGGEPDDKIERVFLCDSPIDALSLADMDRNAHKGQPPVRTMYMAVDDPNSLPLELLKDVNRIALAFNNDEQGNQTAQVVQKMLPQAKRVAPSGLTWNEILIEAQQKEMQQQKQRSGGFSR